MATGRRVGRTGLSALLLSAVVMSAAPAAATASGTAVDAEIPVTVVGGVDAPPVTVPVAETPVDQLLPPVTVPPGLPSPEGLVEPLRQVLAPPPPPGTGRAVLPTAANPAPAQQLQPGVAAAETGRAAPPAASSAPPGRSVVDGSAVARRREPLEVDMGRQALRTASQLWFPLVIAAALVAFLTLQWFVDRRDPKLAVCPLSDEVLGFS